jgi:hypothetical protein
LLHGCEVWGLGNLDEIDIVHLKFLKHILKNEEFDTKNNGIWKN